MAKTIKGRIAQLKIPKKGFELAAKIYKKYLADGAMSELKNLVDEDWNVIGPTITLRLAHHTEVERLKG